MVKKSFQAPPRVTLDDRQFVVNNPRFLAIKSIKNARGTLVSKYNVTYWKGNKKRVGIASGQATTTKDQTVSTEIRGLIRDAYLDAIISFKEANGISYDTNIIIQHRDSYFIYYEKGKPTGKRITNSLIKRNIPDEIGTDKEILLDKTIKESKTKGVTRPTKMVKRPKKSLQERQMRPTKKGQDIKTALSLVK